MSKIRKSALLLLLMFIFASGYAKQRPEQLIGIKLDDDKKEVTLIVSASGCTQKGDFTFKLNHDTLTIYRIREDNCKAMSEAISLTYTFKEAGIDGNKPFILKNQLLANPMLSNIPMLKSNKQ